MNDTTYTQFERFLANEFDILPEESRRATLEAMIGRLEYERRLLSLTDAQRKSLDAVAVGAPMSVSYQERHAHAKTDDEREAILNESDDVTARARNAWSAYLKGTRPHPPD